MSKTTQWLLLLILFVRCEGSDIKSDVNEDLTNHLKGQIHANLMNSRRSLWKAQHNRDTERRMKYFKGNGIPETRLTNVDMDIPDEFDARKKWPQCESIGAIQDQSLCGSSWAVAAAEVMTDRACIATNGTFKQQLSAFDILTCCMEYGSDGCEGGAPLAAFSYWTHDGVVAGGDYENKAGCKPYPFRPCSGGDSTRHVRCFELTSYMAPPCQKKCSAFTEKFPGSQEEAVYGAPQSAFYVYGEKAIQKELMTNGPLTLSFWVYDDFLSYKNGVYEAKNATPRGGHAVKVIGWGKENNKKYWLLANSWNTWWGEDGFFRMIRGVDNCKIESYGAGALVDISRL